MAATISVDLASALTATPSAAPPKVASIVVATDGTEESDSAFQLARAYAERYGATLSSVSVCEPAAIMYDWPPYAPVFPVIDPELDRANRLAAVQAQMLRLGLADGRVPVTVNCGTIAAEIASHAQRVNADLIVTGRGRHGLVDRVLGEAHLARLLRAAPCPVLAVEPTLPAPPRRVVVGIDFSAHGLAVARLAAECMAEDGALYLVHVKPDPPFGVPHPGQWLRSYDDGVRAGLEQLKAQLALPVGRVVEPIAINGHPGVALAEFAQSARADLIAVGAQGAGFFSRLVIGSVTTYLLRAAPCSLLAVPGPRERRAPAD